MSVSKLSVSGADCYQSCPRRYYYRYELRRVPLDETEDQRFGKAWHSYREGKVPEYTNPRLEALNYCYRQYWADQPVDILAHEYEFEVPAFDGVDLTQDLLIVGRLDGIGRHLYEYKTTSSDISPGSQWWERKLLDRQTHVYMGALWALGYDKIRDVTFDVARKPVHKQKSKESPEDFQQRLVEIIMENPDSYFQRQTFSLSVEQVEDAFIDMYWTWRQIPIGDMMPLFPKNPQSCLNGRFKCDYHGVCLKDDDINNDQLFKLRTK